MTKGYVIENGYLIERLILESPLPQVSLVKNNGREGLFIDESDLPNVPTLVKEDYPYLFRSPDNGVIIYSREKPTDFIEHSIRQDFLAGKGEVMFKRYHIPPKLTYSKRETIEKLIMEAIKLSRSVEEKADIVIAETIAKKIEFCFASGI